MDLFKQAKTVWRLIVFRCDIHTTLSIFKTCRENRELSREEPLWRYLCERDYGRVTINSPRTVYRFRYLLGGRVLFSRRAAINHSYSFTTESFRPRYIFDCGDFYCITFDGNCEALGSNLYPRVRDGNNHSRDVLFDPVLKAVKFPEGICSKPVDMRRVSSWVEQHFVLRAGPKLVYLHYCVCFEADLLPGHMSKPTEENVVRYYLHYSGQLTVRTDPETVLDATLEFEGVRVEIPNFYLA